MRAIANFIESIFIKDTSGAKVNVSTKEKQDLIIAAIAAQEDDVQVLHDVDLATSEVYVTTGDHTNAGGWYDLQALDARAIQGSIFSTQQSAIGGLIPEWSDVGTEGPDDPPQYPIGVSQTATPNRHVPFTFAPIARYFRVRYQNGATPATVHGQITFHKQAIQLPVGPIAATQDDLSQALLVKAFLSGRKDNGEYGLLSSTNEGYLRTAITDILDEMDIAPIRTGWQTRRVAVGVDPVRVDFQPLEGRNSIEIFPMISEGALMWAYPTGAITPGNGRLLQDKVPFYLDVDETSSVYCISDTAGQAVQVTEV